MDVLPDDRGGPLPGRPRRPDRRQVGAAKTIPGIAAWLLDQCDPRPPGGASMNVAPSSRATSTASWRSSTASPRATARSSRSRWRARRRWRRGWPTATRPAVLAVDGATVVGYVAVIPGVGWSSHVGELRLVVDPAAAARVSARRWPRRLVAALEAGCPRWWSRRSSRRTRRWPCSPASASSPRRCSGITSATPTATCTT